MGSRIRKPIDKEARKHLWAECPRPSVDGMVALISEIAGKMATFITKFVKDPKKGIDCSWRACQDKVPATLGPLNKILDMAEEAKETGNLISPDILSG